MSFLFEVARSALDEFYNNSLPERVPEKKVGEVAESRACDTPEDTPDPILSLNHSQCTFVFFEDSGNSVTYFFRGTGDLKSFVEDIAHSLFHVKGGGGMHFQFYCRPKSQEKFGDVLINDYLPSVSISLLENEDIFDVHVSLKVSDDRDPEREDFLVDVNSVCPLADRIWHSYKRLLCRVEEMRR